jgi:hypothetical protein
MESTEDAVLPHDEEEWEVCNLEREIIAWLLEMTDVRDT